MSILQSILFIINIIITIIIISIIIIFEKINNNLSSAEIDLTPIWNTLR